MTETTLDGGEAVLAAFRQLGVDYIMASSGSEWTPIWEAMARQIIRGHSGPAYIDCVHESVAVAMTIGYTRVTGRMQAVLLHTAVGLLQGSMGIRAALAEQVPMLVCVGESGGFGEDSSVRDKGVHWTNELAVVGGPARIAAPFVKWSTTVLNDHLLYNMVGRAGEISQQPPSGPVLVSIPLEVLSRPFARPRREVPLSNQSRIFPDPALVRRVAKFLVECANPIIITERIGETAQGFNKLIELCEMLSIPVAERPPRFANFPSDHPLNVGPDIKSRVGDSDFFLVIADKLPWYPQAIVPSEKAQVAVVDLFPIRPSMPYQTLYPDICISSDPVIFLESLISLLKSGEYPIDQSNVRERRAKFDLEYKEKIEARRAAVENARNTRPIDPIWLCEVLNELVPEDGIYVEETITHGEAIRSFIRRNKPHSFFHSSGGGLGLGLGTALGVKLGLPERFVSCLIGDGSLLYNPIVQAFSVSKVLNLPVMVVVFNNHSYASMGMAHRAEYPRGYSMTSGKFFSVDIVSPNFADFAVSFGGFGARVDDPSKLRDTIAQAVVAVKSGNLALVDVQMNH
jgi:acetolactate synthase I/II/III large subunit